jgi:hypothetical protein
MPIHFSRRFSFRILGLLTAVTLAVVGCSSGGIPKVAIKGTVTYKGKPLESGMLKFIGAKGASVAAIKSDGTYTITDVVVPDEVKVCVSKPPPAGTMVKERPFDLPDKYSDPAKSGLQYAITADTRELNIEIK